MERNTQARQTYIYMCVVTLTVAGENRQEPMGNGKYTQAETSTDGQGTEEPIERRDGWMDGWTDGRMDGWMDGWTDGRMDGWADGWMDDGWMDGWMYRWTDGQLGKQREKGIERDRNKEKLRDRDKQNEDRHRHALDKHRQ